MVSGSVRAVVTWNGNSMPSSGVGVTVANRTSWAAFTTTTVNSQYAVDPDDLDMSPTLGGDPEGDVLGTFQPGVPGFISATQIASGPNKGVSYFSVRPSSPVPIIYIHPLLNPGNAWYSRQTGPPPVDACDLAGANRLHTEVTRHEGVGLSSNSHVGIADGVYLSQRPDKMFDSLIVKGSVAALQTAATTKWKGFYATKVKPAQNAYDSLDYPRVKDAVGCTHRP